MDMQTQMRLTGLATGLDTDSIIANLGRVHTARIDTVKRDRQYALWRQDALRNTITMINNFVKSNLNISNPASNFRSSSAFAKFSYNLAINGMQSEAAKNKAAEVLSVTANGDLKNFNQSVQAVAQLASKDTWSGSELGLRGVTSSGFKLENFITGSGASSAIFTMSIDGVSRTVNVDGADIMAIHGEYGDAYAKAAAGQAVDLDRMYVKVAGGPAALDSVGNYMKSADFWTTVDLKNYADDNGWPYDVGDPSVMDDLMNAYLSDPANFGEITTYLEGKGFIDSGDWGGSDWDTLKDAEITISPAGTDTYVTLRDHLASPTSKPLWDAAGVDTTNWTMADRSEYLNRLTQAELKKFVSDAGLEGELYVDGNAEAKAKDFEALLNKEIARQFGGDYSSVVKAKEVNGGWELSFHKSASSLTISNAFGMSEPLNNLGIPGGASTGNVANKTLGELFGGEFFTETNDKGDPVTTERTLMINGTSIRVAATDTIAELSRKINNSTAGVELVYNSAGDRFTLSSKQDGTASNIQDVSGATAQFFEMLGIGEAVKIQVELPSTSGMIWVDDYKLVMNGELGEPKANERFLIDGGNRAVRWNSGDNRYDIYDISGSGDVKVGYLEADAAGKFVEYDDGGLPVGTDEFDSVSEFLGIDSVGKRDIGKNLVAVINGEEFTRQSNTFYYEGMTYSFTSTFNVTFDADGNFRSDGATGSVNIENPSEEIKINVGKDTAAIIESIKGFVEEYNKIIDHINGLLNERRDRDYKPLSDDEKKAMKQEEIEAYEARAKLGIANNDADLRRLLNTMRTGIYQQVEGVGLTMSDIGITTTPNWQAGGRLEINETKLTTALENNYDQVVALFTKTSDIPATDTANRDKRTAQLGIAQRLNEALNDAVRTTRDANNNKGYLIEKAGMQNDASVAQNSIQRQIDAYDKRIQTLLDRWYRQENALYMTFARMETAMMKMQSQQSNLASIMANQGQ